MPSANVQARLGAWEPVCLLTPWPLAQFDLQIIGADADVDVQDLPINDVRHHRLAPSTTSLVSGKLEKRRKKKTLQENTPFGTQELLSTWACMSVIHVPTLAWAWGTPTVL